MNKFLLLVILCLVAASLVAAEKEIQECTKRETELRVAKEECTKATSLELSARKDRDDKENAYKKALKDYDFAYAEWQVATKDELAAKNAHTADLEVLTTVTRMENELCNKLVRNVDNGTPCSKLLRKARRRNRLEQCRVAKKNLIDITAKEAASKKVFQRLEKIRVEKNIKRQALAKIKDDAFEQYKVAKALWTTRHASQTTICARYNTLKIAFHGSKGQKRQRETCKTVEECVSIANACAETVNGRCVRNKVVCNRRASKRICARRYYRPRVQGPATCRAGEVFAFRKEGRSLIRSCKRQETDNRREMICQSTYDPYVYTFNRKGYEMKSEGDYELYASLDGSVEVHNRQSLLPNSLVTVNSKLAILANGADLLTYDCRNRVLTLKGKSISFATRQLPNGGSIKVSGGLLEVFAANGDKVLARINGQNEYCWINTYVYSRNTNGGGLCYAEASNADKYRITGLFKHFEVPHESRSAIASAQQTSLNKVTFADRKAAFVACDIPNLPARFKKQCERDWLLAVPAFRASVISGYKQMLRDEVRGHVDNGNFF